ncbi:hypothetical protein [Mariniblastus fucicola]|uniref:Uncharacterized protein n=1 Tax=Mariniblastus fucicola TaxID=980251 RepID=A0A5B9P855_9BACT|nr:hypothetical protein [Mariniblastus fucicola]QEG21050.1 hypothetical protein MFFC18_09020 [Mariniblastus fucicola]
MIDFETKLTHDDIAILGFLGLNRLFEIYPSVDQALVKIRRKMPRQNRQVACANTAG